MAYKLLAKNKLEVFIVSFLIFGFQMLFVRAFNLFFVKLDVQALIPWSFTGILISCFFLSIKKFRNSIFIKKYFGPLQVFISCALYALSCLFIIHQGIALAALVVINVGLGMILARLVNATPAYDFYLYDFLGGILGCIVAFVLPWFISIEATFVFFMIWILLLEALQSPHLGKFRAASLSVLTIFFIFLSLNPMMDLTSYGGTYLKPSDYEIAPSRHGQILGRGDKFKRVFTQWSSSGKAEVLQNVSDPDDIEYFVNNINYFSSARYESRTQDNYGVEKKAFVIGAGGGLEIRHLKDVGFKDITAVEINEVLYDLVLNKYPNPMLRAFNDILYIKGEGRNYLESQDRKFDIIVINYVGTAGGFVGSSDDLSENYLFTSEAFRTYYKYLNDGGMLAIGLVYSDDIRPNPTLLRKVESASAVLREMNVDPKQNIWVLGEPRKAASFSDRRNRGLFIMRRGEASARESEFILGLKEGFQFRRAHIISAPDQQKNLMADLEIPQEELVRKSLEKSVVEKMRTENQLKVSPVTDSAPYFYQFEANLSFPLANTKFLFFFTVGMLGLLLGSLYIFRSEMVNEDSPLLRVALGGILGFSYGVLEIALLNSFILAFSSMTWNFALLILGLLLASVLVGYFGKNMTTKTHRLFLILTIVGLVVLSCVEISHVVFEIRNEYLRSLGLILFTLVISFGACLTYPVLLKRSPSSDSGLNSMILGVNAGFFILGSLVCRYVAMIVSLQSSFLLAAILYFVVLIMTSTRLLNSKKGI